jgi:NADH dehydrogenase
VSQLGAPTGKAGALKVNGCLELEQFGGVWAAGDSAEVPKPNGKDTYGATAQNAMREGRLAAQNIVRRIRGEAQQPFRYRPIGQLALVGKHRGVAWVYGWKFCGLTAYLLWRGVYLLKMPSLSQRLRVISDWCADVVLGPADEYLLSSTHTERNNMQAQR